MKKVNYIKLFILLLVPILLVGCGANNTALDENEVIEKNVTISLGDTGVTFELPSEHGFEAKTSTKNDFYGLGDSGTWAIIVNHEDKGDFAGIEEYAQAAATANKAGEAKIASDGNYYFEYENGDYHYYTAVRQNNKYYYRVAFYCMKESWTQYENNFAEWATTIKLEQNVE